MPGPGLDLIGDEELAELSDVIRSGHLSRYGPDDESFPEGAVLLPRRGG